MIASGVDVLKTLTVLLVEDDLDIHLLLRRLLKCHVAKVLQAYNGEEGFQMFWHQKPDLILTDVQMPVLDGLSMVQKIRYHDQDIPIIVATAHNRDDVFLRSIELGIDRFVLKPSKPKALLAALEKCALLLQQRRYQEANNDYIRFLLDAQPSFLMVMSGNKVEYINRAFLNYLGFDSLVDFQKSSLNMGKIMITGSGMSLFQQAHREKMGRDWIHQLLENPQAHATLYLRPPGTEEDAVITPFAVTANSLPEQGKHLFSFSDITHIENEKRVLEQQAYTDALTGTYNRARLQGLLNVEMQRSQRHGTPFSVMLCDLDHFKRVNDTYGHQVGDDVLKMAAHLIKSNIRVEDIVARCGGEEFMVVSPQSDKSSTQLLAEKLRELIHATPFPKLGNLTCSFGVAQFVAGDTVRTLTERADQALYRAKDLGRNRVEVAH